VYSVTETLSQNLWTDVVNHLNIYLPPVNIFYADCLNYLLPTERPAEVLDRQGPENCVVPNVSFCFSKNKDFVQNLFFFVTKLFTRTSVPHM